MKKVSKETIIRTVVLLVALVNNVLTMFGKNPLPFSENEIYSALSAVATVAASIWAWWKNNSFTQAAIKADEYMHELKSSEKENIDNEVKEEANNVAEEEPKDSDK